MANKDQDKWCVYQHIAPSGKRYFGITVQPPHKRWQNGNGYKHGVFSKAVQKYGWGNIDHYILALEEDMLVWLPYQNNLTLEITNPFIESDAKKLETTFIKENQTFLPEYGYNRTFGGEAEIPTAAVRKKMSETRIRLWANESFRSQMTGRNSFFWKGYDKIIFPLLDENPLLTLEELANAAACNEKTASSLRKEWFNLHPELEYKFDRSGSKNPNYRGLDKAVFAFLDHHPNATCSEIMSTLGCDESTAIKYRKLWRADKGIKSIEDRIFELLDSNPEMMLKELMLETHCSETTASKYRKRWQQSHPEIKSRRNQFGEHNPKYREEDKRIFAFLDQCPKASLKEIMHAVSCSEKTAVRYRRAWKSKHGQLVEEK